MVPPRSLWVHRPNRHRATDRPSCDSGYDVLGPQVALRLPTSSKGIALEVHLNYVQLLLFGQPEGRYPAYAPQRMAPRWARFLPERRDQALAQPVTSLRRIFSLVTWWFRGTWCFELALLSGSCVRHVTLCVISPDARYLAGSGALSTLSL